MYICWQMCLISLVFCVCGCTLSVTCIHSQGSSSAEQDEAQTASPDVKADLTATIPASAL